MTMGTAEPAGGGAVAHQFDDPEQQLRAVHLGVWAFLGTEVLLFGGLFAGYTVARLRFGREFAQASRHLYQSIGATNTAVLLVSSLTMALAVRSARLGLRRPTVGWLVATGALGAAFLALKALEYVLDIREGLLPGGPMSPPAGADSPHAELFLLFYWIMTGLHGLHVTGAVAMAGTLAWLVSRAPDPVRRANAVEAGGLYWHFVDVVWLFLLPLLYLVK
jgi:cytochrome c oxidase subunit 3